MHLRHDPNAPPAPLVSFDEFLRVDIRVGTIIEVDQFPEAKNLHLSSRLTLAV
jgi:tRNA-binding protein